MKRSVHAREAAADRLVGLYAQELLTAGELARKGQCRLAALHAVRAVHLHGQAAGQTRRSVITTTTARGGLNVGMGPGNVEDAVGYVLDRCVPRTRT